MSTIDSLVALAEELGESINDHPENVDAALPQLESILNQSAEVQVVIEAVIALGHAWDPRAVEMILERVGVEHEDAAVRLAVAQSLPWTAEAHPGDPCWERTVTALITLSADTDSRVRNWACFGLGHVEASSLQARDALAMRLTDSDDETRCEALRALAATGDDRALSSLEERLALGGAGPIYELELQAAAVLADPKLYPLLLRLDEDWRGDDDDLMPLLELAMSRCRPDAAAQASKAESALVDRVNALLAAELSEHLNATLVGMYPRTRLTVSESTGAAAYESEIWQGVWAETEPSTYPLEQVAQSAVHEVTSALKG